MDHLKRLYLIFRPMICELSKKNIHCTKDASESEFEQIKEWLNENMSELVSNPEIAKSIFYMLVKLYEDNQNNNAISYEPKGINLEYTLNKLKKDRINVVWLLTDSGATLKGFSIHDKGFNNRKAKKQFADLLNILEFPDNAKNIFLTKDAKGKEIFRLSGITIPIEFLNEIDPNVWAKEYNYSEDKIIRKYCKNEMWKINYDKLLGLLHNWFRNSCSITDIDFFTYNETVEILLNLIPLTTEDDILKTKYQYDVDRLEVESVLYAYYKKNKIRIKNLYLQEIDKLGICTEKANEIIDFIHMQNFHKHQKTILMNYYASDINDFIKQSDLFMYFMKTYKESCKNSDMLDFEYYNQKWHEVINPYKI